MEVEKYNKINKYKIFNIRYLDNQCSTQLNIDEVKLELKQQESYLNRYDKTYTIEYKFSNILQILYNKICNMEKEIENVIISNLSEYFNFLYEYFAREFSNINNRTVSYNYSYNNIEIVINFYKNDHISIKNIRKGYLYCLDNTDEETLRNFINLYHKNTRIDEYINTYVGSSKCVALFLYISLEIKSFTNIKKAKLFEFEDEITKYKQEVSIILDEIDNTKINLGQFNELYQKELDDWKTEKEKWYSQKESELQMLKHTYEQRAEELEKLYSEKLKLDEPSKYWETNSIEYHKKFKKYLGCTVAIAIGILVLSYKLISKLYLVAENTKNLQKVFPISFVTIALISFMIYLLRTCIKLMLSSKHLETEYKQKSMFTYFYLSLLGDEKTSNSITESEKNLIYSNLFSSPETGLVKEGQDNNDILSLLNTLLRK